MRGRTIHIGAVVGRLTLMALIGTNGRSNHLYWRTQCRCGQEKIVRENHLRDEKIRSCGCLRSENSRAMNVTHGHTRATATGVTPEYRAWTMMQRRCRNRLSRDYPLYGGRGIEVCERWRNSFEAFLIDMGTRPSKHHSIDRIDVDGDYEPDNCRWATPTQQARNKRCNRRLFVGDETLPVAEWAERAGIPAMRIYRRLRDGWSPTAAVLTPLRSPVRWEEDISIDDACVSLAFAEAKAAPL